MAEPFRTEVDVLVVGGGPAGLAAATWLGRYQRSTLVVDAGRRRNEAAISAHGLLGRDPTTPQTLIAEARAGLEQYPQVSYASGEVRTLRSAGDRFTAEIVHDDGTGEPSTVSARRVVLATGMGAVTPDLHGFDAHYGVDVHHCLACDGFEERGREVVVLGGGEQLAPYASELLDWAETVRLVAEPGTLRPEQREDLEANGVTVIEGRAAELVGDPGSLRGVRLSGGELVPGESVFFSLAHRPANVLAKQLGCELDEHGLVQVNGFQLTSVAGVYAAGDLTPGLDLVAVAIGTGTAAGVACATSLRGGPTVSDARDPTPPARHFA